MSKVLEYIRSKVSDNPYVTFDSEGKGVSRVFDLSWNFSSLNQNQVEVSFKNTNPVHRKNIQSYIYAVMDWQIKDSPSNSHSAVSTIDRYRSNLVVVSERLGSSDFATLSNEHVWNKFMKKIKGYGSESGCKVIASTINVLNKVNLIDRFVTRAEYCKWIKPGSKGQGQAIAIPESIYANFLKKGGGFCRRISPPST
ncbi:hypothetical protein [Vibrio parahaemolyticus]|uniref:hypothetical protein n=1 Tax=Vibrio parahaemolyticus TaxID=670 RepID=UPI003133B3D5